MIRVGVSESVIGIDLHALTREFVDSGYRGGEYAGWPIDCRIDGFLRRRGLGRHADDGDICNAIIDRVMTYVSRGGPTATLGSSSVGSNVSRQ